MSRYNSSGWHFQSGRHSNAKRYGHAGGTYSGDLIKGGLADNINPKYLDQKELRKGIKIEEEHTKNPLLAREIATDHIIEQPQYYEKLEKIEKKPEPIKIKITHKEIRRAKNQLEKDLSSAINQTKDPSKKKELEHFYRELRKADSHSAIIRYMKVYGNTIETFGIALPFQIAVPVITGAMIFSSGMLGTITEAPNIVRMSAPLATYTISSEATKHSIRTYKAIKAREKQIIDEKTKELKENTTIPDKEIHKIAHRIALQELSKTKIIHEIM